MRAFLLAALASPGKVTALTADLNDPEAVEGLRSILSDEHADAGLLAKAADAFVPKPFPHPRGVHPQGRGRTPPWTGSTTSTRSAVRVRPTTSPPL
ncbi:hypothetical protein ACH40E_17900 [Streptomyces acidicola]|uniref:hypothetical protein n=1 Tax=Streptomyces acidicola TaxID=2596892 RepID=UPI00379770B5